MTSLLLMVFSVCAYNYGVMFSYFLPNTWKEEVLVGFSLYYFQHELTYCFIIIIFDTPLIFSVIIKTI